MLRKLSVPLLTLFLFLLTLFLIFFNGNLLVIKNQGFFNFSSELNLLVLGKPGPGYIGSENTDSIIVFHYDRNSNQAFFIPIPRDLVVKDEKGNLEKINALYEKGEIKLLLKKAQEFTGFDLKNYFVFDLNLVTKLVDFLNGLEVELKEPVTDAITLYTLPSGKQKLNGYLIELVLRSRYHPEGDFFRIKNQLAVIKALKDKITTLSTEERLQLIKFLEKNKYSWQTNLSSSDVLALATKIKDPVNLKIIPVIVDLHSGFLKSGYFKINGTENVYGIYPSAGIDNFLYLRNFIQSQVNKFQK